MASNRVTSKPVFPQMDYTVNRLGDTAAQIIFHTTYNAGDGSGQIPFLGYTIDSSEERLRVVAWYDIRDAKTTQPVERHDTIYFRKKGLDSMRLVAATVYRDSLEYPFSTTQWNPADSFYFFSRPDSTVAPQAARLRVRAIPGRAEMRLQNPDRLPLSGLELLNSKGTLLRKLKARETSFSTAGLQAGIYFLRFRSPYGNRVEVFIVTATGAKAF